MTEQREKAAGKTHNLLAAFSVYCQPPVLAMIVLGFSAGLPFSLVSTTLSAWLADEHVSLAVIGYFSLVGVAYSLKVLWAPLVDRLSLPLFKKLGKRRSWLFLAQCGIGLGLFMLSQIDIHQDLLLIASIAVFIAFCSATQDIVIDAYRIEVVVAEFQGAMAAAYVFGYRLALLAGGAGALYLAQYIGWQIAYQVLSAAMLIGIVTTFVIAEPVHNKVEPVFDQQIERVLERGRMPVSMARFLAWFADAVVGPFVEFFQRNGRQSLFILLLIGVYKLSDMSMGVMANPFYLHLGFSKKDIADITKLFGFIMTIVGTSLGGMLVLRFGIFRPLLAGAIISASTNLLFAWMAGIEPSLSMLAAVISADNLGGGIAAAAFIAYLSSLTHSAYTATQYALFSSLMTLPAKLIGGFSGILVADYGYAGFFVYSAVIGLPAILLVIFIMSRQAKSAQAFGSF